MTDSTNLHLDLFREQKPVASYNLNSTCDGSIRWIFYGRYSSDNQDESSIRDQLRNCREAAKQRGWVELENLHQRDEEKSGRTQHQRPGLKALMEIAKAKPKLIDYIVIDDTSRFGRNAADTMQLAQVLKFRGVSLLFAEDRLDSQEPSFWERFTQKAIEDERASKRHGNKVQRGQVGHFKDGYNPGGGCFGYRNVPEYDPTKKGIYGLPGVKGVKQVIDPEKAEVVRRIFNQSAAGMSQRDIAIQLNQEGIPTSQGPRSKRKPTWSKTTIAAMIANPRYIGHASWGKRSEDIDPETGKFKHLKNPQSKWLVRDAPELRIISLELWNRVHERNKNKVKIGIQKQGGMSRTPAARRYILSGLLRCGLCGSSIIMVDSKAARYGCSDHRNRGVCMNRSTVKQKNLEEAFVGTLGAKLRSEALREEFVIELHAYLTKEQTKRVEASLQTGTRKAEMEMARAKYMRQRDNLLGAIKDGCGSRLIYGELSEIEGKINRLDESLDVPAPPPEPEITLEEVRGFLAGQINQFEGLLLGAPETVKAELQRRIEKIIVTPVEASDGPYFRITGDVDLFSAPTDVLQPNQVYLIGLQYSVPIECEVICHQRYKRDIVLKAA